MIPAVADTGPLLHLHEARALHFLPRIAEVHIPPLVQVELLEHTPNPLPVPDWLSIHPLSEDSAKKSVSWQEAGLVDSGEADALALALQISSQWFLTDDAAARLLGEALGLEVHGSLGIILYAASTALTGHEEAHEKLVALKNSSLWLSERVFQSAEQMLAEIFNSR